MNTAQDSVSAMQAQTLEAIKSGQQAAVQAMQAWTQATAHLTPEVPGLADVSGLKDRVGNPAAIVDSVYDFTAQLMQLNKEFVHSLLEAGQTVVESEEKKPAAAKAAEKK